jgi:hypothetical protein
VTRLNRLIGEARFEQNLIWNRGKACRQQLKIVVTENPDLNEAAAAADAFACI